MLKLSVLAVRRWPLSRSFYTAPWQVQFYSISGHTGLTTTQYPPSRQDHAGSP